MELACPAGYLQGLKIAIESGADPATILVAITPIPDTLFECSFAALLCEKPTEVTRSAMICKCPRERNLSWKDSCCRTKQPKRDHSGIIAIRRSQGVLPKARQSAR
jgi:hypothetical protein|tara:strand:+ start:282 stop:599 length:318 start_codon:yes stop_codon:yes gene_type:complete